MFIEAVFHDPPLLFNVEQDPGETTPLSVTSSEHQKVIAEITLGVYSHNQTLKTAWPIIYSKNASYILCCNATLLCNCSHLGVHEDLQSSLQDWWPSSSLLEA